MKSEDLRIDNRPEVKVEISLTFFIYTGGGFGVTELL